MNQANKEPDKLYHTPPATRAVLLLCAVIFPAVMMKTGSAAFGGILFLLTVALQALLFLLTEQPAVFLTALPAYLLGRLLTGSFLEPLTVFAIAAAAFAVAAAMRRGKGKTSAVLYTSVTLGVSLGIIAAAMLFAKHGRFSPALLEQIGNDWFDRLRQQMLEMIAQIQQSPAAQQLTANGGAAFPDAETVDQSIIYMKWIVLGLMVDAVTLLSYLCVSLTQCLTGLLHCPMLIRAQRFEITVSRGAGLLYCGSYVVPMLSESRIATIAALNMIVILAPGLFVAGCSQVKRMLLSARRSRSRVFLVLLLVFSLLYNVVLFVNFVILVAVWHCFLPKKAGKA